MSFRTSLAIRCAVLAAIWSILLPGSSVHAGGDAPEEHAASKPEALREMLSVDVGARRTGRMALCVPGLTCKDVEYFPCALAEFLATGDEKKFLEKIPLEATELSSIWQVDEALSRAHEGQGVADTVLGEPTFIRALIKSLGDVAKRGNTEALDRMLGLQAASDGWMAEETAQANLDVFSRFPWVLVDNWPTVKKHAARIGFGTTDFADQRSEIEQRYAQYCVDSKRPASDCERAVRFLARD
jgi:hypothetical protein